MDIQHATVLYFSPSGTTERTAKAIAKGTGLPCNFVDLLAQPDYTDHFAPDELVLVCMPVFGGRLPSACPTLFQRLTAENSPAVGVVVYGNREYEDAGVELLDLLSAQGFIPFSSAAVVAQHSLFPKVAAGRPSQKDIAELEQFGQQIQGKLSTFSPHGITAPPMPGNRPYRDFAGVPIKPRTSSACTKCGVCVKICPANAIPASNPQITDEKKCISCTACVPGCPAGARSFGGFLYKLAGVAFTKKNNKPKQSEFYFSI